LSGMNDFSCLLGLLWNWLKALLIENYEN